ncbi:MAG: hypothetical protein IIX48_08390 [Lachnospiraceae bacterium]|nr:hypothetical protein [Lachnospiraceae bacterium]
MNDTYIEFLVKKPDSKTATLLHILMIGVGAVLFLVGFFIDMRLLLPGIILLIGSIIPNLFTNIEYEYLLLEKELTVDRIRKQEKRKTVANYKLDSMVVMAPKGSEHLSRYAQLKAIDYSSGTQEGQPFEIVVDGKGGKVRIIIDTSKELIDAIRKLHPRDVFLQ